MLQVPEASCPGLSWPRVSSLCPLASLTQRGEQDHGDSSAFIRGGGNITSGLELMVGMGSTGAVTCFSPQRPSEMARNPGLVPT